VGGQDADLYTVQVGSVRLAPTLSSVTLRDLAVSVDSVADAAATEPSLIQEASLGRVSVSGLRLIPLLLGREILVSAVELIEPTIVLAVLAPEMEPSQEEVDTEAPDSGETDFVPPNTTIRRVTVRDASLDVTRVTEQGVLLSFVHGLDLELTEITIDQVTLVDPARALANSRVTLAVDTVRHLLDDSLFVLGATDIRADSRDSVFSIGTLELIPTLEPMGFFGRLPVRGDWIELSAGPVLMEGLDFRRYVKRGSAHIRLIDVDSLDLHVYSNINMDWGPSLRPCQFHMGFAEIPVPLRVDTIRASGALIRYSELSKGSERPGVLTLEDLDGTIVNLTNDAGRMTYQTPAVAHVTAKLFGEGRMEATLAYPLLSPTVDFNIHGSVGPMDLATVNRFATNTAGLEVERGELDSLWVRFEVRDGHASGRIQMEYRDLDFRLIDRNTGKQSVLQSVLGFLGNAAVKSNNPSEPGRPARPGVIDYTCGEDDMVFFELFVHALASGLKMIAVG